MERPDPHQHGYYSAQQSGGGAVQPSSTESDQQLHYQTSSSQQSQQSQQQGPSPHTVNQPLPHLRQQLEEVSPQLHQHQQGLQQSEQRSMYPPTQIGYRYPTEQRPVYGHEPQPYPPPVPQYYEGLPTHLQSHTIVNPGMEHSAFQQAQYGQPWRQEWFGPSVSQYPHAIPTGPANAAGAPPPNLPLPPQQQAANAAANAPSYSRLGPTGPPGQNSPQLASAQTPQYQQQQQQPQTQGGHPGPTTAPTNAPPSSSSGSAQSSGGRKGHGHNHSSSTVYSFVPLPGAMQKKRPRRRYEEIERIYKCGWQGCEKAYGTLNHLNAHVTMQNHGPKRTPEEFKETRKEWKARKKENENRRKAELESKRQMEAASALANASLSGTAKSTALSTPSGPPASIGPGTAGVTPTSSAPHQFSGTPIQPVHHILPSSQQQYQQPMMAGPGSVLQMGPGMHTLPQPQGSMMPQYGLPLPSQYSLQAQQQQQAQMQQAQQQQAQQQQQQPPLDYMQGGIYGSQGMQGSYGSFQQGSHSRSGSMGPGQQQQQQQPQR